MSDKSQLAVWCIENNKEVFINDIEKEFSKYLKDIDNTVTAEMTLEDGSTPHPPSFLSSSLPQGVKNDMVAFLSVQSKKSITPQSQFNRTPKPIKLSPPAKMLQLGSKSAKIHSTNLN